MEKERYSQLELFSPGQKEYGQIKSPAQNRTFLNYIWGYEKIILTIMGLVITGIISFSLGVEKGKKLAQGYKFSPQETRQETNIPKAKVQPNAERQDVLKPVTPADSLQNYYTIQLASYQSKTSAQKEADALKRKGLLPLVLSKGKYTVLCVGNFADKETARPLLSELKKRYQDCFIRRL